MAWNLGITVQSVSSDGWIGEVKSAFIRIKDDLTKAQIDEIASEITKEVANILAIHELNCVQMGERT